MKHSKHTHAIHIHMHKTALVIMTMTMSTAISSLSLAHRWVLSVIDRWGFVDAFTAVYSGPDACTCNVLFRQFFL